MPRPSFTKVEIETGERREPVERPEPEDPFHIAILGDFSGRDNRGVLDPKLQGRKPVLVDRDNFDDVLARFAPELNLPLGGLQGPRIPLRFRESDDFHPDRIFEQLKIFQALRETRERLSDRSTFDSAAAEVRSWSGGTPKFSQPAGSSVGGASRLSAGELFEETLKATESRGVASRPARALDDFQALLRDIVAPYIEPKPDPQGPELIAQVDAAISGQMRALLHHPDFQALEALWRGVSFLVRRLSTGVDLKVFLIDITKPELGADLVATYELLIEKSVGIPGVQPWAVLAGNYTFDRGGADLATLARMAAVARHAGAPFIAAASSSILEDWKSRADPEAAQSWDALRRLAQANWIGLALPRFLLRLPYGRQTDSTESFAFEEFPAGPRHEDYLWGNPAFACAYLLGEAFSESGWNLRPGEINEINGLPAHAYRADGESYLKPCAETLLAEDAAEAILDQGLMPLLSIKGSDLVRLLRFQSIAEPVAPLAGRWS